MKNRIKLLEKNISYNIRKLRKDKIENMSQFIHNCRAEVKNISKSWTREQINSLKQ